MKMCEIGLQNNETWIFFNTKIYLELLKFFRVKFTFLTGLQWCKSFSFEGEFYFWKQPKIIQKPSLMNKVVDRAGNYFLVKNEVQLYVEWWGRKYKLPQKLFQSRILYSFWGTFVRKKESRASPSEYFERILIYHHCFLSISLTEWGYNSLRLHTLWAHH